MKLKSVVAVFLAALLASCSSTVLHIDTGQLAEGEVTEGMSTGSSQGMMILFVPVGQNQRFERAYTQALQGSGGKRLVDLTVKEDWWSAFFVSGFKYTVTGTVVK